MNEASAPLVSVLMPAFNASHTIQFAIASLLSQDYRNWECLVIDDGSTDDTAKIVAAISDPRIKLIGLDRNYGRGIARQRSLEEASGKYVTMLDADDWIYPDKISQQVSFLEKNPAVSLHSMGMAILDDDRIVSVRRPAMRIDHRFDVLHRTFIPHAPSMIRRADIGRTGYDSRLKLAQDQDFLRRVLVGKRYVVSREIGYCYTEIQSVNLSKIIRGYAYNSFGYSKLFPAFGTKALLYSSLELSKIVYILVKFVLYGQRRLLESRSSLPLKDDFDLYAHSRKVVVSCLESIHQGRR